MVGSLSMLSGRVWPDESTPFINEVLASLNATGAYRTFDDQILNKLDRDAEKKKPVAHLIDGFAPPNKVVAKSDAETEFYSATDGGTEYQSAAEEWGSVSGDSVATLQGDMDMMKIEDS